MGKGRKMFRKKASWITYIEPVGEAFYQLNQKGELVKQDNKIVPHHYSEPKCPQCRSSSACTEDTLMASEPESDGKKLDFSSMNPIDVEIFTDIFGGSVSDFNLPVPKFASEETLSAKGMNFWVSGFEIEPLLFL